MQSCGLTKLSDLKESMSDDCVSDQTRRELKIPVHRTNMHMLLLQADIPKL